MLLMLENLVGYRYEDFLNVDRNTLDAVFLLI